MVFRNFSGDQREGHFSPSGIKSGVCFRSAPIDAAFSTGPDEDILKYCVAKQRITVLEKSSSYIPRSVVCVGVAKKVVDMKTTLEDFYYGNITPNEQRMMPDSELKKAVDRVASYEKQLMEHRGGAEQEVLRSVHLRPR